MYTDQAGSQHGCQGATLHNTHFVPWTYHTCKVQECWVCCGPQGQSCCRLFSGLATAPSLYTPTLLKKRTPRHSTDRCSARQGETGLEPASCRACGRPSRGRRRGRSCMALAQHTSLLRTRGVQRAAGVAARKPLPPSAATEARQARWRLWRSPALHSGQSLGQRCRSWSRCSSRRMCCPAGNLTAATCPAPAAAANRKLLKIGDSFGWQPSSRPCTLWASSRCW